MLALLSEDAQVGPLTEAYSRAGEVKGQGYSAGGIVLTGYHVHLEGLKAWLGFSRDVIVPNASISARGGLVYNASKEGKAIGVIDFGQLVTSTNGNFKVQMSDLFWIA